MLKDLRMIKIIIEIKNRVGFSKQSPRLSSNDFSKNLAKKLQKKDRNLRAKGIKDRKF